MERKTAIFGMSHVGAIRRALQEKPRQGYSLVWRLQEKMDLLHNPEEQQDLVKSLGQINVVCLLLNGNVHNVLALLNSPRPFYLVGTPMARHFIPQDMMLKFMRNKHEEMIDLSKVIFDIYPDARRIILNPPPPTGDENHIRLYPDVFGDKIDLGVSPDALRVKMYDLQTEIYATLAASLGAAFISCPPFARDETGKLAERYWIKDPTHANGDYGQLMLDAIEAEMKEPA